MSQPQRTVKNIVDRIRFDLTDQVEPYFWSDDELLSYINEAQLEFCQIEVGAPIIDSVTPEVCEIPYEIGDTVLELHSSILEILSAYRDDDDSTGRLTPLRIETELGFVNAGATDDYGNGPISGHSFTQAGQVRSILVDHSENLIRLGSPADLAGIIRLRVERGPIKEIENFDDPYEVHRRDEPAMVAWADYLSYLKQDADTFDPKAAQRWKDRFDGLANRANLRYIKAKSPVGRIQCRFP